MPKAQPLEREVAVFERNRQPWAAEHAGQYVVIQGEKLIGFYDTFDQAYQMALKQCGAKATFFVKQISAVEPVYHIA
jgi:hypothetical protein